MIGLLSHAVKSFIKGFLGVFLILGILSAIFSGSASASDVDPVVKMSKSEICHAVDSSDAMTDYFDTAYYTNIRIGKWDKPYVFTGAK